MTNQTRPKERKAILDRFHAGEYNAVVTCQVLNEGVDVPAAGVGHRALGHRQRHRERAATRPHPPQVRRQAGGALRGRRPGTAEEFVSDRRRQHSAFM
jgi:hypothetical protein